MDLHLKILSQLIQIFLLIPGLSALLPPPDISNVSLTIDNQICADTKPFLALILVMSHPGRRKFRSLTRETYPAAEIRALGIRRVFVLAMLDASYKKKPVYGWITQSGVRAESEKFSDLLQFNYTESYHGLTLKDLAAFTWAVHRCAQARLIVKTDDDVFIDYYSLAAYFQSVEDADTHSITGRLTEKQAPMRNFKNYMGRYNVDENEFPGELYPEYTQGPFYATSPRTMSLLVEAARTIPYLHNEDVFFTGLAAEMANVTRLDMGWRIGTRYGHCCRENGTGSVYHCEHLAFEQNAVIPRAYAQKLKVHGVFCYFHDCEKFTGDLLKRPGVQCC